MSHAIAMTGLIGVAGTGLIANIDLAIIAPVTIVPPLDIAAEIHM